MNKRLNASLLPTVCVPLERVRGSEKQPHLEALDSASVAHKSVVALDQRCRLSLLSTVLVLIPKDFHASEPLEYCFIEYSLSLMGIARESHFPCGQQRDVLDST